MLYFSLSILFFFLLFFKFKLIKDTCRFFKFSFFALSLLWCVFIGFNGNDIPAYINYANSASLSHLYMYSRPDPFVGFGVISAVLKLFFPSISGEHIIITLRVIIFCVFPTFILLFSSPLVFSYNLAAVSIFTFLSGFSLLSAANTFTSGVAYSLFILLFLLNFNLAFSRAVKNNEHRPILLLTLNSFFVIMIGSFHGLGVIFSLVLIFSLLVYWLKLLRLSNFLSTISIIVFSSFVTSLLVGAATSQKPDSTAVINSLILALLNFNLYRFTANRLKFSGRIFKNQVVHVVSVSVIASFLLSLISIQFSILGGGDAAERLTLPATIYTIIVYLSTKVNFERKLFSPIDNTVSSSLFIGYSMPNIVFFDLSKFKLFDAIIFCYLILQMLYFYSSNAFFENI